MKKRSKTISIGNHKIGNGYSPFIVAEMSGNHNQSLENAISIVESAAQCGAHAVKLQTYTADTMTLDINKGEFMIDDPNNLWKGQSLYQLYEKAFTPWEWHKPILKRCFELGIVCFSTPFDSSAIDFLEELEVPAYKISSFENTDLPLIRKASETGKPIIISTGMASLSELDEAIHTAREAGCKDLILLKCTSSYPATPESSNISTIPHLRELFDVQVGISDHTLGIGVSIASIAFGATFIEKLFINARVDGGVDAEFSLEPKEFKKLVEESNRAWLSIGKIKYGASKQEEDSKKFRRSLYIVEDVKAGETLTIKNLRNIRPGLGLKPKYFDEFLGKKIKCDIKKGTPMKWEYLVQ